MIVLPGTELNECIGKLTHVDSLNRDSWINNDPLSTLQCSDDLFGPSILLGYQWTDIRLNSSCSQPDDNDRGNEASVGRTILNGDWKRGAGKDQNPREVNDCEVENGIVSAKILICDNCTNDRRDVAPLKPSVTCSLRVTILTHQRTYQNWKKSVRPLAA